MLVNYFLSLLESYISSQSLLTLCIPTQFAFKIAKQCVCHAAEKQISAIGDPLTMQIDLPAWLIRYRWVYILHVARINDGEN